MLDGDAIVGRCDVVLVTLDTLRYDVAVSALEAGRTPALAARLPGGQWEERHSPGSFTYAAHQAFFAGFFPTPARPGAHPRLFALRFEGSETITDHTCVFDAPDLISGFAGRGYHTACIGGEEPTMPSKPNFSCTICCSSRFWPASLRRSTAFVTVLRNWSRLSGFSRNE